MPDDWEVLRPFMGSNFTAARSASFEDAVHLFSTNALADVWNWERLNLLGTPVAHINAEHTLGGYRHVSADRFRGLQPHLFLVVGARVFVNNNIWTSAGLANGAVGVVVHMHWPEGRQPSALYDAVLVRMENYSGEQYFTEESATIGGVEVDLTNVVPIAPIEAVADQPSRTARRDLQGEVPSIIARGNRF